MRPALVPSDVGVSETGGPCAGVLGSLLFLASDVLNQVDILRTFRALIYEWMEEEPVWIDGKDIDLDDLLEKRVKIDGRASEGVVVKVNDAIRDSNDYVEIIFDDEPGKREVVRLKQRGKKQTKDKDLKTFQWLDTVADEHTPNKHEGALDLPHLHYSHQSVVHRFLNFYGAGSFDQQAAEMVKLWTDVLNVLRSQLGHPQRRSPVGRVETLGSLSEWVPRGLPDVARLLMRQIAGGIYAQHFCNVLFLHLDQFPADFVLLALDALRMTLYYVSNDAGNNSQKTISEENSWIDNLVPLHRDTYNFKPDDVHEQGLRRVPRSAFWVSRTKGMDDREKERFLKTESRLQVCNSHCATRVILIVAKL